MRYRSNNGYGVPMVIRAPYGGGVHGALYHSQSVEAFFTHVPGLKVVVPSTPYDARGPAARRRSATMTRSCSSSTRRCTARSAARCPTPTTSCRSARPPITHPGSQVTVIAYGLMAHYALEAADRVADDGHQRRGRRPADAAAARHRDAPRVRSQDRQVPGRVRGQQVRRVRGGGRGDRRRGGVRLPGRPGHPGRRTGGPGRALQPRPRGLVHGHRRTRSPTRIRTLAAY